MLPLYGGWQLPSVQLGGAIIAPSQHVRVLGVIFSADLSLEKHVSNVSATCFYHLRRLQHIRRSLTSESATMLMHAFVTSPVDYCTGSRCRRESSSGCVCWQWTAPAQSTVPHPTTLPRPFIQSLAVAPDSVYDLPTRRLYLCHPHAAQLLAIAHFRRLPHEHGTLYHNRFRTQGAWSPQSRDGVDARSGTLYVPVPPSCLPTGTEDCAVPVVLSGWLTISLVLSTSDELSPAWQHWLSLTVRWSCSRNATMPP